MTMNNRVRLVKRVERNARFLDMIGKEAIGERGLTAYTRKAVSNTFAVSLPKAVSCTRFI